MGQFSTYIGIDYSGAQVPTSSLKGLRIYAATGTADSKEIPPPPSPRSYWTRRELAEWLVATLRGSPPTIVGIDHAFSFPLAYFERHRLPHDWHAFLDDFCIHWPTDGDHIYVDFVRDGSHGSGAERMGETRWRRVTEIAAGRAKSPFHFDVQGSVAKSTHAGLPWLKHIRDHLGKSVHFWPFDGWEAPPGVHVIAEVYPSLWRNRYSVENRTPDQQDAYTACRWLREADQSQALAAHLTPALSPGDLSTARFEGWILGVIPNDARMRGRATPSVTKRQDEGRSPDREGIVRSQQVECLILVIRGQKVLLDADLASLYGVKTKALNQAVKRNAARFPEDFAFQLSPQEVEELRLRMLSSENLGNRSQIVTGSQKHRDPRYLPYAFTEHGAIMAANVLNTPQAVRMSVFVVRAFVKMREHLIGRSEMEERLLQIENVLLAHDDRIRDIYEKIRPLLLPAPAPDRKPIGFDVRQARAKYIVDRDGQQG